MEKADTGSHSVRYQRAECIGIPPILYGMIDTAGKLLERIICKTLETFLGEEDLSNRQFNFRKPRSTMDAIEIFMTTAKDAISDERWLNKSLDLRTILPW